MNSLLGQYPRLTHLILVYPMYFLDSIPSRQQDCSSFTKARYTDNVMDISSTGFLDKDW